LPRTWMSAENSRSITCSSSSLVPSKPTIEWPSGMTIRIWEPGKSLLVSVNSLLSSAGWPGQRASTKHMRVHVPDGLPAIAARVEDDPVSAGSDAFGDGDVACRCDELVKQSVARTDHGRHVGEVIPWDHKDMGRRLRVDVAEGYDPLPVQHDRGRDLSGSDPAEQAFWHSTIIVARPRRPVPDITSAGPRPGRCPSFSQSEIHPGATYYSSVASARRLVSGTDPDKWCPDSVMAVILVFPQSSGGFWGGVTECGLGSTK